MSDLSHVFERMIVAPKKLRQAAMLAAEAALNGEREALIVTQAQAARMLSCSRFTIYNMVKDGTLHPVKIRGVLRYRCSELRALAQGVPEKEVIAGTNIQALPKEGKDGR